MAMLGVLRLMRTHNVVQTLVSKAIEALPSVHPGYTVIEWDIGTTYEGRRYPAWEVNVRVRGPQGELSFNPICTFMGRPGDLDDEVALMVWCIRANYNMAARSIIEREELEEEARWLL